METEFNLQQLLTEMEGRLRADQESTRRENRRRHRNLSKKVDTALETLQNHDTRIVVVERTRKNVIWLSATAIVALISAAVDFFFAHLPSFFASSPKH
jgi:hypothetical protein